MTNCSHRWESWRVPNPSINGVEDVEICALCGDERAAAEAQPSASVPEAPAPEEGPETPPPADSAPPPPTPPKLPAPRATVRTGREVQPLVATDMETAYRMASAFAKSRSLPKTYYDEKAFPEITMPRNDPKYGELAALRRRDVDDLAAAKAFTAMQMGAEVGLPPMMAIQSIAVINGVATIWGDTQKALVLQSGKAEYVKEGYEGGEPWTRDAKGNKLPNTAFVAWCETKRFDSDEVVRETFSVQDAIDAGLWSKDGPWKTHPKRMLRYKARAFALRDTYADVLKGLAHSREEMEGEMIDVTPPPAHTAAGHITPHNPAAMLNGALDATAMGTA